MKHKILLSICAGALLAGGNLYAFGISGNGSGSSMGNGGDVRFGANENGAYICLSGHDQLGHSGSMALSFGSASGCEDDDFDFYYKSWGGFVSDTDHFDGLLIKPGPKAGVQDGPWYREGEWSAPFYAGDFDNDGKRYDADADEWPAFTWGRFLKDPFINDNENEGGSGGIGIGGFASGDGNKIKADDGAHFYPASMINVVNNLNVLVGSWIVDLKWHIKLYDKDHKEVYNKDISEKFLYWETLNYRNPKYDIECPRTLLDEGEKINDLAFNTDIHDNKFSKWPIFGLDNDFYGDGTDDSRVCADAAQPQTPVEIHDTFSVGRFFNKKEYDITIDGPYVYDSSIDGCPAINEYSMPDTEEKWDEKCFKKVSTIWVDEKQKKSAFMRIKVEKHDDDKCGMHLPDCDMKIDCDSHHEIKCDMDHSHHDCDMKVDCNAKMDCDKDCNIDCDSHHETNCDMDHSHNSHSAKADCQISHK